MKQPRKFLVVDDNSEGAFLLTKTLLRKFPNATIQEQAEADGARAWVRKEKPDAIVIHRAWDGDAQTLVRELRQLAPDVPIVAVSGVDRSKETLAAGANRFLHYDEWLRLGSVVAQLLGLGGDTPQPPFPTAKS